MSTTLEMPMTYSDVVADEFDEIDGGAVPIFAIIGAVIAVGGVSYGSGQKVAERAYYAGLRNTEYQKIKWNVRAAVIGLGGLVAGGIFMLGFENKFYSMI